MQVSETIVVSNTPGGDGIAPHATPPRIAPPAGTRTPEGRRERTREQILDAARAALVRIGYENITTRRIAEEAGVNIATLHYYFGSKESLLSETVQHSLRVGAARLRAAAENAPDAFTALEQLFGAVWEIMQERAGVLRFDLAVRGLRDPQARQDVNSLYTALRSLVAEIIERHLRTGGTLAPGISAALLSHYVLSATDGVVLQHMLGADDQTTLDSLTLIKQSALAMMRGASDTPFAIARLDEKSAAKSGQEEETQ